MRKTLLGLVALAALAGCGNNMGEQALIGASAGAVGTVLLQGDPLLGAVVGAGGNVLYCQYQPGACRRR
jgi:hypothetical protein